MKYFGILLLLLFTGCAVNSLPIVTVPQPLVAPLSQVEEDDPEIGEPAFDPWKMWHDHSVFTTCVGTSHRSCAFHLCAPHDFFPNGKTKLLAGNRKGQHFTHSYYFMRCQNVSNKLKNKLDEFLQWKSG